MPIRRHDRKDLDNLEAIILQNDGQPLHGEIDMYRRICRDCEKSPYTWHFWHDLRLNIPINKQAEIQIDFFLVCEKGAIVVEVKGGKIGMVEGEYYYEVNHQRTFMTRTPFAQARDYMQALIDSRIINRSQIYIDTVCAFPHSSLEHTTDNPTADLGYKLWSRSKQEDESVSFADFCIDVLNEDRERCSKPFYDLYPDEVEIAISSLLNTFEDRSRNPYSEHSIQSILERLHIDNLSVFNSLQKNDRLFIEGGPGTGKTTIAKAYIDKYHTLRGLYLCWNKLLDARFRHYLGQQGFVNCEVYQFASYIHKIEKQLGLPFTPIEDLSSGKAISHIKDLVSQLRSLPDFLPYDYIIVDEAQDTLDKGVSYLINGLSSVTADGIKTGRYLVFYDIEQGYHYTSELSEQMVDELYPSGAHFLLDVNRRVPTNKEIVSFANSLLGDKSVSDVIADIEESNYDSVKVFHFDGAKSLVKHINSIKKDIKTSGTPWDDFVVLADSSTKHQQSGGDESLYDRIATIDGIKDLTPQNICSDIGELPFTSILTYKGLECKHVVLVVNNRSDVDKLELYVGMTRAIVDLQILILE